MDQIRMGALIARLRREKRLTQLQLAEQMHISDKTISKWERGKGCPDVSMLPELSRILEVDLEGLLSGRLAANTMWRRDMKRMNFYLCPDCGNLIMALADASVSCCAGSFLNGSCRRGFPPSPMAGCCGIAPGTGCSIRRYRKKCLGDRAARFT